MENLSVKRIGKEKTTELRTENGVAYLVFPAIEKLGIAEHLFSTRIGGVSEGCYESMNLSYTRGDEKAAVDENYCRISEVLGHGHRLDDFVSTFQTHTTNVRVVTDEDRGKGPARERDYIDVDGLITNAPGIILSTFHADCPPVYFIDPVKKAIGLAHSGWKGTLGEISANVLRMMKDNYGTEPADVICAIGPSICGDCYEIGEDVAIEFKKKISTKDLESNRILVPYPEGKYRLHLWNAIKLTLLKSGVKKENIYVTDICTKCNPELLFSHRVHHEKRGNLAAFLCLKKE